MTPAIDPCLTDGGENPLGAGGEGAFAAAVSPPASPGRTFAGLPVPIVVMGFLMLAMALWAGWATRELLALRSQRIVSVSLATLVRDFVTDEARNGGSPAYMAARTKVYTLATQAAMQSLTRRGTTILVSEAVVGNSVPDITPQLKSAVDAKLKEVTGGH